MRTESLSVQLVRSPHPDIVTAARDVLEGRLTLPGGVPISKDQIHSDWKDALFEPEEDIVSFSQPAARNCLSRLELSSEEEDAVWETELDDLGIAVAARIYREALTEAFNGLMRLASAPQFNSARLNARLCSAIREELAVLVEEWETVAGERGGQDDRA